MTLQLLWQEYKAACPEGFQYSWFCEHYRAWAGKVDLVMRQTHRAGEAMFVDYAGHTVPIIDRATGEVRQAQIFVAVLGASNYTFAEATWTQQLPDWIGSHQRAFAFFGGVPETVVPDNLKSAVTRPHRYEPKLNRTYNDMAGHYGTAVLPARVAKPQDKGKVEVAVQVVERWILARLRHQTLFSLDALNEAIAELLDELNARPFKKLPGSRRELYEQLDRPALSPLPSTPYTYATWKVARVSIDYHIEVERHYYSVPYQLVKEEVEACVSAHTVEIFHRGKRVASHRRSARRGQHTTIDMHMPRTHREYAQWTPQRLVSWARKNGPATDRLIEHILTSRRHPQQGFRSCLGILRLGKTHGEDRLEAACPRCQGSCRLQLIFLWGLESDEMQYPESLRNKVIERAEVGGISQDALAEEFGVSRSSIQNWLRQYRQSGEQTLPAKAKSPESWSRAQRLDALLETHGLSEEKRGAWCRQRGVHTHQLEQWRRELIDSDAASGSGGGGAETRSLRQENKALKKELRRKEKALAETSALLVLKKEAADIWGEVEDD